MVLSNLLIDLINEWKTRFFKSMFHMSSDLRKNKPFHFEIHKIDRVEIDIQWLDRPAKFWIVCWLATAIELLRA